MVNNSENALQVLTNTEKCAIYLADKLKQTKNLLLDVDGVVMEADGLEKPVLTDQRIPGVLAAYEKKGIKIGVATSRSFHIINHLKGLGLEISGPSILEDGMAVYSGAGEIQYLVSEQYLNWLQAVVNELNKNTNFKKNWGEVKSFGGLNFCLGNEQWQGKARHSWWMQYPDSAVEDPEKFGQRVLEEIFIPVFVQLAEKFNLKYSHDIASPKPLPMATADRLMIITVRAKDNGGVFEKVSGARVLGIPPAVFVADGYEDDGLALHEEKFGGGVVGIMGSLDLAESVSRFLMLANRRLQNSPEWVEAMILGLEYLK